MVQSCGTLSDQGQRFLRSQTILHEGTACDKILIQFVVWYSVGCNRKQFYRLSYIIYCYSHSGFSLSLLFEKFVQEDMALCPTLLGSDVQFVTYVVQCLSKSLQTIIMRTG